MSGGERALALRVTGRVQGVNYRNYTKGEAKRLGVRGWVRNCEDGSVEAVLYGSGEALGKMIELCRRGPSQAGVDNCEVRSTDRAHADDAPSDAYAF